MIPVRVDVDFAAQPFFLVQPKSLSAHLGRVEPIQWLKPESFPPLKDWKGKFETPGAWLGVRSPVIQSSVKMKAAILGALALTSSRRYRHMFSGRKMFGGRCTIDDSVTTSFEDPHTPPLMEDIVITDKDAEWLTMLAEKLSSNEKGVRRQLRSLEYFYKAWALDESERFPIMCMTLDAIFGDTSQTTQSVIDSVRAALGSHVSQPRLGLLMELRASVIHGGAPDVYDSRKYGRYYEKYGEDPILDLELVVARCLRKVVFDDVLTQHEDPYASKIAEMQAKGQLPPQLVGNTILDEATD